MSAERKMKGIMRNEFGTYEDRENRPEPEIDLGNGYTKDGEIALDYLQAGTNPELPRQSPKDIERRLHVALANGVSVR